MLHMRCLFLGSSAQTLVRMQNTITFVAKDAPLGHIVRWGTHARKAHARGNYARTASPKFAASSINVIRKQLILTSKLSIQSSALPQP